MTRPKLKVSDMVKVTGYRPGNYPPGGEDLLGSEALFKSMVGKQYRVLGFDHRGHIELRPTPLDTVWIEADLVKVVAERKKTAKPAAKRPSTKDARSKTKPKKSPRQS